MDIWGTIAAGINKAADGWMTVIFFLGKLYSAIKVTVCLYQTDAEGPCCLICAAVFSLTVRRHHCRACCRLVCGTCSPHSVDLDGDSAMHRVCKECFAHLDAVVLLGQLYSVKAPPKNHFEVFKIYKLLQRPELNWFDFCQITIHAIRGLPQKRATSRKEISAPLSKQTTNGNFICNLLVGDLVVSSSGTSGATGSPSVTRFTADPGSPLEAGVIIQVIQLAVT